MRILDLPKDDRPREKALSNGFNSLSNSELLALIIGSGKKGYNAIELSQKLLISFNSLSSLVNSNYYSLKDRGIKDSKVFRLLASFELAKRYSRPDIFLSEKDISFNSLKHYFSSLDISREQVNLLIYSKKGKIIRIKRMYEGTSKRVSFSPAEIIKEVNLCNGSSFILVHNHPSNVVKPSSADILLTTQLKELSLQMDIKFIDHLIVGETHYYSFNNEIIDDVKEGDSLIKNLFRE